MTGSQSREILTFTNRHARSLIALDRLNEARPLLQSAYASFQSREREFSKMDDGFQSDLGATQIYLGQVLGKLGVFKKAEAQLLNGHKVLMQGSRSPAHDMPLDDAAMVLAEFYDSWDVAEPNVGHKEKAAPWRQRAEDLIAR